MKTWMASTLLLALLACSEKPQELVQARQDAAAYTGTGSAFTAKGWKAGDKTSWEQQLRARAQGGQNEYNKTN